MKWEHGWSISDKSTLQARKYGDRRKGIKQNKKKNNEKTMCYIRPCMPQPARLLSVLWLWWRSNALKVCFANELLRTNCLFVIFQRWSVMFLKAWLCDANHWLFLRPPPWYMLIFAKKKWKIMILKESCKVSVCNKEQTKKAMKIVISESLVLFTFLFSNHHFGACEWCHIWVSDMQHVIDWW